MRTLYKSSVIITLIAWIALSSSCKKFLSPEAASTFDTAYVFSNITNARSALLGAYMSLAGDYGYGIRLSGIFPYDCDEAMKGTSAAPTDDGQRLAKYQAQAGNAQLANPFSQLYQGIERANQCIYHIPNMPLYNKGNAAQKAQLQRMYGEALVLRAQFLFELCRNWGDVPVSWLPSQYDSTLYTGRISRDTIYTHIINDLAMAETLMPWRLDVSIIGDQTDQRFTKGTAKALRAKIALTRGGYSLPVSGGELTRPSDYLSYYTIARDECWDLMQHRGQHTLLPNYKSLFKDYLLAHNTNDPAGEFMMVASMIQSGDNGSTDSKLGIQTGTRVNGVGGKQVYMLPTYFYMFDSTDVRRDVTCVPYEIYWDTVKTGHAANAIFDGKFRKEWVSNPSFVFSLGIDSISFRPTSNLTLQNMELSWPMIRFADVLLWFAEADNELNQGPSAAAVAAVNEVDARGHGYNTTETPIIPNDHDGFFKFIVKERMLEFGDEGIRKYDLIRWNLLAKAISETQDRLSVWYQSGVAFTPYSYMQDAPSYAADATQLPTKMFYVIKPANSNIDAGSPFVNSYYLPSGSTGSGQKSVKWSHSGVNSFNGFAPGFKHGKSELFPLPQGQMDANPKLTPQNFGY